MAILVETEERPGYVLIKFAGAGKAVEFVGHFVTIVLRCQQAQVTKCLSNMTAAQIAFSDADRYMLGQSAEVLGQAGIRLAVLATPTQLDPKNTGANTAKKAGTTIQVFTDEAEAVAWLMADG